MNNGLRDDGLLDQYAKVAGDDVVDSLRQLASPLAGARVLHVNSTKEGGGVAEVLRQLIPLEQALGIDARWEVITGDRSFYECTKSFHNALQGTREVIPDPLLRTYEETNAENAERLRTTLAEADFVFVHDPQPAAMLQSVPERKGIWIWRCHIDVRRPYRPAWRYLRTWVSRYDASIFSLPEYAQPLPHPQYLIPPSIDPLNQKNCELPAEEVAAERERFGLDPELPLVVQVSRFDRFKDPVGVIAAYRLVKAMTPIQLVLAGGGASDDPEGEVVLEQVRRAAEGDPDIHVLLLPSDAHRTINALQRAADLIMQKSIREGFGLTVTEGMWKRKPVIGGDTGGIRLQVIDHYTGFRVRTPKGAALRTRFLLHRRDLLEEMGERAHRFVGENFLITRHVREHLTLMLALQYGSHDRIEMAR